MVLEPQRQRQLTPEIQFFTKYESKRVNLY